jgi:radical SAM superfamily enzyme YgiQ (UPF0313 family)
MRILLVNPSGVNMLVGNNPQFLDENRGCNFPIGLGYLASSILHNSRHFVKLIDLQTDIEQLNFELSFGNYDVVGITTTTFTLLETQQIIETIHQYSPRSRIIVGGVHATLYPIETINLGVNAVIQGEGEEVFTNIIDDVFRKQVTIEKSGLIKDLDTLSFPLRMNIQRYNSVFSDGLSTIIITSRGCPFKCKFCYRAVFGKTVRFRSPDNVIDEIKQCYEQGIKNFLFYDDTFTINRERVVKICNLIISNKLKIKFDVRSRVDMIDFDLLKLLKKAGMLQIHLGVESGVQSVLDRMEKGITLTQVEQAFKWCGRLGIRTLAYIMIGCPSETRGDIAATVNFVKQLKPDYLHATIFTPLPGSSFYDEWVAHTKKDVWKEYANEPTRSFVPPVWGDIPREELEVVLDGLYREFYLRPTYIGKRLLEVRSLGRLGKYFKAGWRLLKR